jgi:hypothetical protein
MIIVKRMTGLFVLPRVTLEMESTWLPRLRHAEYLAGMPTASSVPCGLKFAPRVTPGLGHKWRMKGSFCTVRPFVTNSELLLKLLFISRIPTQVLGRQSISWIRVMSRREGQFVAEQSNVFYAPSSHEPLMIHVRLPSPMIVVNEH